MALPPQYSVPPPMRARDGESASGTPERRSTRPPTSSAAQVHYSPHPTSSHSTPQRQAYPMGSGVPSTPTSILHNATPTQATSSGNPLLSGKPLPATPDEEARRYTGPLPPPRPSSGHFSSHEGSGSSAVPLHPSIRRSGSANSIRGPSTRSSRSSRSSAGSAASPPSSFRLTQAAERTTARGAFSNGTDYGSPASNVPYGLGADPDLPPSHPFLSRRESRDSNSSTSSADSARRREREREEKDRQRLERRRRRAAKIAKAEAEARRANADDGRPTLTSTISLLLLPFRLVLMPLRALLGPVVWHILNTLIILLFVAGLGWMAVLYIRHALSGASQTLSSAVGLPVRLVATPACIFAGIACEFSLVDKGWEWRGLSREKVDVAAVSRGLSKEARHAKDIFESLTALGDGRMTQGLGHVRIHELGIAISTGSTLDQREMVGLELIELADLASELTDEIVAINAMSVTTFSWLFWEFSSLVNLLGMPNGPPPSKVMARLDSLLNRLDRDLDRLYGAIDDAIPISVRGATKGWELLHTLSSASAELQSEAERYPGWQRALDSTLRFFKGGDPSKLQRISADLAITRGTIAGIDDTTKSLNRAQLDLKAFRSQVRSFKGSVMGVHLGTDEEDPLGPEMEMRILSGVVEELGAAVGRAKRRPVVDRERGIDPPLEQARVAIDA